MTGDGLAVSPSPGSQQSLVSRLRFMGSWQASSLLQDTLWVSLTMGPTIKDNPFNVGYDFMHRTIDVLYDPWMRTDRGSGR